MIGVADFADKAGDHIDASRLGQFLGFNFVAHRGNCARRRPDESDIFRRQCLNKARPFRQETIAGVNSLCPGLLARIDDFFRDQIALSRRGRTDMHRLVCHTHKWRARIGIGINCNSGNPHPASGFDNTASNLTAIGNQYLGKQTGPPEEQHKRKPPMPTLKAPIKLANFS